MTNAIAIIWFVAAVIFAIVEAVTTGLTSIWFAGGAVVAGITALFTDNLAIQIGIFLVVSIILIAFTRPLARKYLNNRTAATNIDAIVGSIGRATCDFGPDSSGEVRADGKVWKATSAERIREGSEVRISDIKGVTLIVEEERNV